ncbi:hypothetical protein [Clavibacter capsici]|uniref:hypothetical protein n=1 Tax=Clavibacter capsici TaxID=1874630 RepID=UPI00142819AE|nr:hypothetical protein [Clavibacter capsici]QIS39732.1 hypothetical protein GW572_11500 [Clavibacter capsici]
MADLPSIRSVMPWWYVAGAVLSLVVTLILSTTANLFLALALWCGLIVREVRDRRGAEEPSRGPEGRVALVLTPLFLGIAAFVSQVRPFQRDAVDGRVLVGGAVALTVSGLLLLALRIHRAVRSRARDA